MIFVARVDISGDQRQVLVHEPRRVSVPVIRVLEVIEMRPLPVLEAQGHIVQREHIDVAEERLGSVLVKSEDAEGPARRWR